MLTCGRGTWRMAVVAGVACLVLATVAAGQDSGKLAELKKWYDKLTSNEAASIEDGREALAQLKSWALSPEKLEGEARQQLYLTEIYACLAVGDAAQAVQRLGDLQKEFAGARETLRATWLVAVAAGDAQLASKTLEQLQEKGMARADAVSKRQARLRGVGNAAPTAQGEVESGRVVHFREREGIALVVNFWSLESPPTDKQMAAMRELYGSLAKENKIDMLGVNTDAPAKLEAARGFAKKHKFAWGQHYNGATEASAMSEKSFGVEGTGWQALIDRDGNVRAIGSAGEPEFVYAVRAAVAEARGDFKPLRCK